MLSHEAENCLTNERLANEEFFSVCYAKSNFSSMLYSGDFFVSFCVVDKKKAVGRQKESVLKSVSI